VGFNDEEKKTTKLHDPHGCKMLPPLQTKSAPTWRVRGSYGTRGRNNGFLY